MTEKTPLEKKAAGRQVELLSQALSGAGGSGGYWLNVAGKAAPKLYPAGVAINPFNALMMALHSDGGGYKSNQYTLYLDAKARGYAVRAQEQGVPFLFYKWDRYVDRNDPTSTITRDKYLELPSEERAKYKGVRNREIRTLYNLDQTVMPYADKEEYERLMQNEGGRAEKTEADKAERETRKQFRIFLTKLHDNMGNVRRHAAGMGYYDSKRDTVYLPLQRNYEHYNDYVQDVLRQIVSATGHQQRLAREGMVMKGGKAPSQDSVKYEALVRELASGVKMLEYGLPARLTEESLKLTDYWRRELKENPCLIDALESDVNNALEVMRKAEKGEKIEYAMLRTHRQTQAIKEQLPKNYFVTDLIRSKPDGDKKHIIVVKDPKTHSADVVLPSGASLEVDNEVPGMRKDRIDKALRKEGIETVRFFNPDGSLGYNPDDGYFAGKEVCLARLRNWELENLGSFDVSEAVKRANEVQFERVQMLKDDDKRWALYLHPENQKAYCIYPDKDDLNCYFTTLKQSLDNIGQVQREIANKYHVLAQARPDLKVNLFDSKEKEGDYHRIQKVSVFKTKQDGILCVATIDGVKQAARAVPPHLWQRMWLAPDRDEYKNHIAATVYADLLNVGQTKEQSAVEQQEQSSQQAVSAQKPLHEENTPSNDEIWNKRMEYRDALKAKNSTALIILRVGDSYEMYKEDCVRSKELLGVTSNMRNDTETVSFSLKDIGTFLLKTITANQRTIVIEDYLKEIEKQQESQSDSEVQSQGLRR